MSVAGFSKFFKGLLGEVGNGRENWDDDVKQVKRGLGSLGYWDEPAHGLNGMIDRALDTGIKEFQADHDLRVDGWIKPGGPTEGALETRLESAHRLRYPDIRVKPGRSWESKGWGGPRGAFGVPILRDEKERIDSILGDRPARFNIEDSAKAAPKLRWYSSPEAGRSAVAVYSRVIERESRKQGIDPNLTKAIAYVENMNGHYFVAAKAAEGLGMADSILPMNINPKIWSGLGLNEKSATQPRDNIRAGVMLIKRIRDRINQPTPAKVASVWHFTGAEEVDDFGAQVAEAVPHAAVGAMRRTILIRLLAALLLGQAASVSFIASVMIDTGGIEPRGACAFVEGNAGLLALDPNPRGTVHYSCDPNFALLSFYVVILGIVLGLALFLLWHVLASRRRGGVP